MALERSSGTAIHLLHFHIHLLPSSELQVHKHQNLPPISTIFGLVTQWQSASFAQDQYRIVGISLRAVTAMAAPVLGTGNLEEVPGSNPGKSKPHFCCLDRFHISFRHAYPDINVCSRCMRTMTEQNAGRQDSVNQQQSCVLGPRPPALFPVTAQHKDDRLSPNIQSPAYLPGWFSRTIWHPPLCPLHPRPSLLPSLSLYS